MKLSIFINQVFFLIMLVIMSSGCSPNDDMDMDKKNDTKEYFVKAKVDGVLVEFKNKEALDGSIWSSNPVLYNFNMFGGRLESGQTLLSESITIDLLKQTSPITEANYSGYGVSEHGLKGVLIIYSFDIQDIVYSTDISNPNSVLEITEISQSSLKGKFSGVVKDFLTSDTKTITDGEFFVPRSE